MRNALDLAPRAHVAVAGVLVLVASVLSVLTWQAEPASAAPRTYYAEVKFSGYKPYCQFISDRRLADRGNSQGCFDTPFDDFAVVDTKGDGRGVAILWKLGTTKRGICRNKRGDVGDGVHNTWPTCRFDSVIPEGRKITAWLTTCDETSTRSCKKWSHWRAQSDDLKRVYRTTHPADGG